METIDLANVMRKVRQEEGWNEAQAATAARRYRRFLCMRYLDASLDLVPAFDIDKVWHQHILHTRDYANDCQRLFGAFLHHAPASGDEAEQAFMGFGFEKTQARYADLFGERYVASWLSYFLL